jgi:hypothetical protein
MALAQKTAAARVGVRSTPVAVARPALRRTVTVRASAQKDQVQFCAAVGRGGRPI